MAKAKMVLTAAPGEVTATSAVLHGMLVGFASGVFDVEPMDAGPTGVLRFDAEPVSGDEVEAYASGLDASTAYRVRLTVGAGNVGSWQEFRTPAPQGEPDPVGEVGAQPAAPGGAAPYVASAAVAAALADEAQASGGLADLRGVAAGTKAVLQAVAGADRDQAELLAGATILSGFDRMLNAQMEDTENDAVDALANEFPDLSERDRITLVGDEVDREREYRAKARRRMERDVRQALGIREAEDRKRRLQKILEREERIARQRRKAVLQRSLGRVEKARVREASPEGGYWALSPFVRSHTADCIAMAGRVWPWKVLESVFPPLHGECPCQILAVKEAKADGLPGADDFVPEATAWDQAQRALRLSEADGERVMEALDEGLPAPELFRWELEDEDGDPFGLRVEEATRDRGRGREYERFAKGVDRGGEFKSRRGTVPSGLRSRGRVRMDRDVGMAREGIAALRERGDTSKALALERDLDRAVENDDETKAGAVRKRATDAVGGTPVPTAVVPRVPDEGAPDTPEQALYGPTQAGLPALQRFGPEARYEMRYVPRSGGPTLAVWDREMVGGAGTVVIYDKGWDMEEAPKLVRRMNAEDAAAKGASGDSTVTPTQGLKAMANVPTREQAVALATKKIDGRKGDELPPGFRFDPDATAQVRDGDTMVLGTTFFGKLKADRRESAIYRHLGTRLHEVQDDEVSDWRYRPKEVADAYVAAATGRADGMKEQKPDLLRDVTQAAAARGLPVDPSVAEWAGAPATVPAPDPEKPDVPQIPESRALRDYRASLQARASEWGFTPGGERMTLEGRGAVVVGEFADRLVMFDPTLAAVVDLDYSSGRTVETTVTAVGEPAAGKLSRNPDPEDVLLQVPGGTGSGARIYVSPSGRRIAIVGGEDGGPASRTFDLQPAVPEGNVHADSGYPEDAIRALNVGGPATWTVGLKESAVERSIRFRDPRYTEFAGPNGERWLRAQSGDGEVLAKFRAGKLVESGYVDLNDKTKFVTRDEQQKQVAARLAQAGLAAGAKARQDPSGLAPAPRAIFDAIAAAEDSAVASRGKVTPAMKRGIEKAVYAGTPQDALDAFAALGVTNDHIRNGGKWGPYDFVTPAGLRMKMARGGFGSYKVADFQMTVSQHLKGRGRLPDGEMWKDRADLYADLLERSKEDAADVGLYQDTIGVFDEAPGSRNAAATHSWGGVIRMSTHHKVGKDLDAYLKARAAGTTTNNQRMEFASSLKTYVHELEHGKHRRGAEFLGRHYNGAGKALEEAITEEAAIHEMFAVLRAKGLDDVETTWRSAYVAGHSWSGGSYREYRTRLADVFDRGEVPWDDRLEIVRELRGRSHPDRMKRLADIVESSYPSRAAAETAVERGMGGMAKLTDGAFGEKKYRTTPDPGLRQELAVPAPLPVEGWTGQPVEGQRIHFTDANGVEHELRVTSTSTTSVRVATINGLDDSELPEGLYSYGTDRKRGAALLDQRIRLGDASNVKPQIGTITLPDGRVIRPSEDRVTVKGRGVGDVLQARGGMVGIRCEDGVVIWYSAGSPALTWGK